MRYNNEIHKNYAQALYTWLDNRQSIQMRGFITTIAGIKHAPIKPKPLPKVEKAESEDAKPSLLQANKKEIRRARVEGTAEPPDSDDANSAESVSQNDDGDTAVISDMAQQMYSASNGDEPV